MPDLGSRHGVPAALDQVTPVLCPLQVLTWTLFALMQQPEVERKLLAELDAEVGDEAVSAPLPSLPLRNCSHAGVRDGRGAGLALVVTLWHWLMSPTLIPGLPAGHVMCGRDCEQCMLGAAHSM